MVQKKLHNGVVPAAALVRHAAADLSVFQQLPVGRWPVLAPLICIHQKLLRFCLTQAKSPIEDLQHQRGFHGGAHGPAEGIDIAPEVVPQRGPIRSTPAWWPWPRGDCARQDQP